MGKNIFLLDDNAMTLESTVNLLQKEYNVMCCRDVLSASRRVKLFKFDIIILDLMMPTRGLDIKDEFKAGFNFYIQYVKPHQEGTPVLFWSNLTESSFIQFREEHQADTNIYFLQKSDDINALSEKIKEILK